jgi:hypothetical protein
MRRHVNQPNHDLGDFADVADGLLILYRYEITCPASQLAFCLTALFNIRG